MKLKHYISFLLLFTFACDSWADIPFRNHRYDSWQYLTLPEHAIVFVGNSITDMHPWAEAFGCDSRIVNRGNSGALSDEVVEHMNCWLSAKPDKVFLLIGTNDLGSGLTVEHVVGNIRTIVQRVRAESPSTQLYLQSILPARDQQLRSLATLRQANDSIRCIVQQYPNTEYVDLFDLLMGVVDGDRFSFDQLHLTALGYQRWCRAIAPLVGIEHSYPAEVDSLMCWGTLWGSNAMRASYFSTLGFHAGDILFFGDEMVKNGEWNELLHNPRILNRGTGWGYGGSIATTKQMSDATFAHTDSKASSICLYTGTEDLASNQSLYSIQRRYRQLVRQLQQHTSGRLILVGLMPVDGDNTRVVKFNRWLRRYALMHSHVEYIDLYSQLVDAHGAILQDYMVDNYLYGKGYQLLSTLLEPYLSR